MLTTRLLSQAEVALHLSDVASFCVVSQGPAFLPQCAKGLTSSKLTVRDTPHKGTLFTTARIHSTSCSTATCFRMSASLCGRGVLGAEFALCKRFMVMTFAGTSVLASPGFNRLRIGSKFRCISVDTNRNAVNERERLRVFGEHWSEHT